VVDTFEICLLSSWIFRFFLYNIVCCILYCMMIVSFFCCIISRRENDASACESTRDRQCACLCIFFLLIMIVVCVALFSFIYLNDTVRCMMHFYATRFLIFCAFAPDVCVCVCLGVYMVVIIKNNICACLIVP